MIKLKQCYFCGRYFPAEELNKVEVDDGTGPTRQVSFCQKCQAAVNHGVVKVEVYGG